MRTKVLLLSAVLAALGVASSVAQVFSVNAVGYVNMTLRPGFNLIANPLDQGANNVISTVLAGVPDGTIVYGYDSTTGQYNIKTYDLSGTGGWDPDGNLVMAPGVGVWVRIPGTSTVTVTFVGEVMQGALSNVLPQGFSIKASQVPQAGRLATDLGFPAADGDVIYQYNSTTGQYVVNTFDLSGTGGWDPAEPTLAVGEGFWSRKIAAGTWTRNFSVN